MPAEGDLSVERPTRNRAPLANLASADLEPGFPSNSVARALLDYILAGHVGPGERLPSERQISEALGIGRSVVREGVKALGVLGLVNFRHGGGTYLRSKESDLLPEVIRWGLLLGERRIVDLIEARRFLEMELAGLAAGRRSEEQLAELETAMVAMGEAQENDEFVAADLAFHFALAHASNNSALVNIHGSIASLLRVWIERNVAAATSYQVALAEHVRIFEAVRDGDVEKARDATHLHMTGATERLLNTLGEGATV